MIIADTNLLACLLLPTAHTDAAERVLIRDSDWIAPALIHSGFRNVLLGALRRKDIHRRDMGLLLDRALEVVTIPAMAIDGAAVLAMALDSGCSAYDCEFAWLARELGAPLVTADRQVHAAFPDLAVSPSAFVAR